MGALGNLARLGGLLESIDPLAVASSSVHKMHFEVLCCGEMESFDKIFHVPKKNCPSAQNLNFIER